MQPVIRGNPRSPLAPIGAALTPQTGSLAILDTNVLLDLWLFRNPGTQWLVEALRTGALQWVATPAMLEELAHVVARPYPARFVAAPELRSPPCRLVSAPEARAPIRCRDASDQMFVDLAWSLRAPVWTRDRALLALKRRAARLDLTFETPEAAQRRLCWPPAMDDQAPRETACAA